MKATFMQDEDDIITLDTNTTIDPTTITTLQGPIRQDHARSLNHKVSMLLTAHMNICKDGVLLNYYDVLMLRNIGVSLLDQAALSGYKSSSRKTYEFGSEAADNLAPKRSYLLHTTLN